MASVSDFNDSRKKFVYVADDGKNYALTLDSGNAGLAGTGLALLTNQENVETKPSRFKPRVAYWQADDGSKRKAFVCNANGAFYTTVLQELTLSDVPGKFVGRRGEKLTY